MQNWCCHKNKIISGESFFFLLHMCQNRLRRFLLVLFALLGYFQDSYHGAVVVGGVQMHITDCLNAPDSSYGCMWRFPWEKREKKRNQGFFLFLPTSERLRCQTENINCAPSSERSLIRLIWRTGTDNVSPSAVRMEISTRRLCMFAASSS